MKETRCVTIDALRVHLTNQGYAQFGHPAAIITFIFLAITAVSQIVALNKGLKVYDSTLVVPVFYGVSLFVGQLIKCL